MPKVSDIGKFVKENFSLTDIALKHAIEDKWLGLNVDMVKHPHSNPPYTVLNIHNEQQDNVLIAMIPRDTK